MSSTTQPAADWHRGRVASWLVSVDHKRIGALYLGWAGLFFVIAGLLAIVIRTPMIGSTDEAPCATNTA